MLPEEKIDVIKLSSINLAVGETTREVPCPCCGVIKDFQITRHEPGLFYVCYRASCGIRGFITSKGHINQQPKPKPSRAFKFPTKALTRFQENFFVNTFGLTVKELNKNGIVWCEETNRIIMPCYTITGKEWGKTARYYRHLDLSNKGLQGPKSLVYAEDVTATPVSWQRGCQTNCVVLVEDQISAIKLGDDVQAIALLGHTIPESLWAELRGKEVIVALDKDVTHKVAKEIQIHQLKATRLRAIPLKTDIKNMSDQEYMEFIDKVYELM